jgi:hypothetical protein
MAPNGRSNLHDDAYQTDTYPQAGPLGNGIQTTSTGLGGDCASVTFDTRGRIVTVCVGIVRPTLYLLDPQTLDTLASLDLPPREPTAANPLTSFGGGGYFYLDNNDRAVIPTMSRHVLVVAETDAPGFAIQHDYDLSTVVLPGDSIVSALPDWTGRIWFAAKSGVVGTIDPATGRVASRPLGESIGNSFATDSDGSISLVTDAALYRLEAGADGIPQVVWRETYANTGTQHSGQTEKGSGTTPTLIGSDLVAITDNADPIDILVYQRGRTATGDRLVCRQPVFTPGHSSTDQSLIATLHSIVVENNDGYDSPASTELGRSTTGGLARVDLDASGCHLAWTSAERAPSVVPKLSLGAGLVYTYTKDPRSDGRDPWWLTALDFRDGKTVYKQLAGEGLGFNNHYAPVTLGPDGTAYVGALGGLIRLADAGPAARAPAHRSPSRRAHRRRRSRSGSRGSRCGHRGRCRRRHAGHSRSPSPRRTTAG